MSYLEKDLASDLSYHLRKNPTALPHSCAIELKLCKKKSLNLTNDFQPQQIPSLFRTKHLSLYHKISDLSPNLKPFDSVYLTETEAYAAILFYKPRQPKQLHFLSINTILFLQLHNTLITNPIATELATFTILL